MGRYCKLFGCDFLARGGIPGGAFCTGLFFSGSCGIRCRQCSSPFCRLRHSVPERASYGTEYAFGAKNSLLGYATRFQRHSVQKTGLWCTEGKFGTGKGLLVYRTHLRKRKTASWCTRRIFRGPQNHSMRSSASEEEPFMVTSPLSYNIFSAMAAQASASARA